MKESHVEHEIDTLTFARTGRTRPRPFVPAYAKAARSGVWPNMETRATWSMAFQEKKKSCSSG